MILFVFKPFPIVLRLIVYYVPRRIMRVITRRATILAGDRSRDKAEARSVLRALWRVS